MSMEPRFLAELVYAGKVITESLDKITSQFSYSDPDGGESDTFSITLADTEKSGPGRGTRRRATGSMWRCCCFSGPGLFLRRGK